MTHPIGRDYVSTEEWQARQRIDSAAAIVRQLVETLEAVLRKGGTDSQWYRARQEAADALTAARAWEAEAR